MARRGSLGNCGNEWVAIADSVDISLEDRFEKQMEYLSNEDVDVVSGEITEFLGSSLNITGAWCVPIDDSEIKKYAKIRWPFNQMTVMIRKTSYEKTGVYVDWYCDEDYYCG